MIEGIEDRGTLTALYSAATLVLGWFARALIAKVVKDGNDRAGDRAVLEHMNRQAVRIRELEEREGRLQSERNEAVSKVGGLETEVMHLTERVAELTELVEKLSRKIDANGKGQGGEQWPT